MLFTKILTTAIAIASATPVVAALYNWDPKLQLYTIGEVPAHPRDPHVSSYWMGQCNGGDIPEGGYGCGTFIKDSTLIYKCVKYKDGNYWLQKSDICAWMGEHGGQCVKNQLTKGGKKFYPDRSGDEAVCVQPEVLGGQPWKPEHTPSITSTRPRRPQRTRAVR